MRNNKLHRREIPDFREEENMNLYAEWLQWAEAYRLYTADSPQETVAWEESLDEAEKRAVEEGYDGLVLREK